MGCNRELVNRFESDEWYLDAGRKGRMEDSQGEWEAESAH